MTRVLNYFKKINKFSKSKRNDAALEKLTIVRSYFNQNLHLYSFLYVNLVLMNGKKYKM